MTFPLVGFPTPVQECEILFPTRFFLSFFHAAFRQCLSSAHSLQPGHGDAVMRRGILRELLELTASYSMG